MQQILSTFSSINVRTRVVLGLAVIAFIVTAIWLARIATAPSMSLLYAGLEVGAAGDVVTALEQRNVVYDVRGGSIFVEAQRRDELRMTLASEGLPANTARGYELLDGLSGFSTTSQMFDAAYWRAKEGELARTILSHPGITSARVHIAHNGNNPFLRDLKPSASVTVSTTTEGLSVKHVRGLKFLVAAAVPGLMPDAVSIIDSRGGLIGQAEEATSSTSDDRTEDLRQRVTRLLEARVGPGNAVVEVSVDTVTRTESVRERVIDPESRVVISTDVEEVSNTSSDQGAGGDVTVASNLPDGEAGLGDNSSAESNETRERINYEVSQTEREVTLVPGAIKRLTVAVLVNDLTAVDGAGEETVTPRSDEEIAALRELVASAVGFDEARGDVITIKTMEFQSLEAAGTEADTSIFNLSSVDFIELVKTLILASVLLILGLFVLRPTLSKLSNTKATSEIMALPQTSSDVSAKPPLTGEVAAPRDIPNTTTAPVSSTSREQIGVGKKVSTPSLTQASEPSERLRNMINERKEETVEILRNWLESEDVGGTR